MRLGFLGFGEAASAIAAGLAEQGGCELFAYDLARDQALSERAARYGVRLVSNLAELAEQADLIFSLVTARAALPVAREIAPHLRAGTLYADLNSCGPRLKAEIGRVIAQAAPAASYASVAIMSAVPPLRHRVPLVADGPGAAHLREALRPYGMNIEILEGPLGAAATLKMCRSVVLKGMEALFLEALLAAEKAGITEQVLASLNVSFPDRPLGDLGIYLLERHGRHAQRRADELAEAAATLAELGIDPLVAGGAARRLRWSAQRLTGLAAQGGSRQVAVGEENEADQSYRVLLRRLDKA
ncbi:NAD(P)-dependent oxidoreductase [Thermogemmatispora sp.]|uniref:NAD(P)-dependent oxidoreductase n=1 Tax=Thermogemmatispora sp. TaxID=1968838 RepID=UPI001D7D6DDC|nr:NAD(P)-dependent oxidoreductase [Thermogemmatispora sp.]MBX5450098.1 NAD(P)-dependent oxidoreductase [Thermogemmatispora sp.]